MKEGGKGTSSVIIENKDFLKKEVRHSGRLALEDEEAGEEDDEDDVEEDEEAEAAEEEGD